MSSSIRFTRPCGTCGRTLEIPIAHIGREVACGHCGGRFIASMIETSELGGGARNLEERIDRLLAAGPMSSNRFRYLHSSPHSPMANTSYEV